MSHLTEDFLRKRSQQILDAKAKSKAIFNKEAEASFPRFKPDGKLCIFQTPKQTSSVKDLS